MGFFTHIATVVHLEKLQNVIFPTFLSVILRLFSRFFSLDQSFFYTFKLDVASVYLNQVLARRCADSCSNIEVVSGV